MRESNVYERRIYASLCAATWGLSFAVSPNNAIIVGTRGST